MKEPIGVRPMGTVRQFETGSTRAPDSDKLDYEGFLSPLVLERFAQYMHKNRIQVDGTPRASDNWQKGIPLTSYMKSLFRHFVSVWKAHRAEIFDGVNVVDEEELCAIIFNAQGYLHELLKRKEPA